MRFNIIINMPKIANKILEILMDFEIRYKGGHRASLSSIYNIMSGQKVSIQTSLTRLSKKGFVNNNKDGWMITENGRKYLAADSLVEFKSPFAKDAKRDLLLMFDIPEDCRHYRNWLRDHLKVFGYKMIQQSVWAGPSPLPKEFKKYIKQLGLQKNIRTFRLAKGISAKW
jgi:DNA-binding transcriptional regulator PaaX